jgi:outer membrane lipoprotein SlyB
MKLRRSVFSVLLVTSFAAGSLQADVVAYPKNGQSSEKQLKDKSYCSQWATQQTGISPEQLMKQQQQAQQAGQAPTTGAGRGAAKGAAVGAAIGGDAGKGAAVGAGVGAAGGGVRKRKQEKEAQQQQQAGQAAVSNQLATFEKAEKACLQGKGYSVQ